MANLLRSRNLAISLRSWSRHKFRRKRVNTITSKPMARKASKQLRKAKSFVAREVAASDLSQAARKKKARKKPRRKTLRKVSRQQGGGSHLRLGPQGCGPFRFGASAVAPLWHELLGRADISGNDSCSFPA